MEKKHDGNYTRMLQAILSKSWRQHTTKQQLYGYPAPIKKNIQVRHSKNAGHCWRSRDELICDILQWTFAHGRAKAGWPARTYIQLLCADTGCRLEDLPRAMDDRDGLKERIREIRAGGVTWWWWWWWWYNLILLTDYLYPCKLFKADNFLTPNSFIPLFISFIWVLKFVCHYIKMRCKIKE